MVGGAGLVGRHVVHALAGRDVVVTYHQDPPRGAIALDVTQLDQARRVVAETHPGVIVVAAADAWVERCEREPLRTRIVNVEGPSAIADAAARIGALFVVFSSEYVFDGARDEYGEEDARHPVNEYGRQKAALEDVALASGSGLVCRTSAVYGDDPKRRNFVCQLIDALRAGRAFDVPSDQLVTPTYAPDLASSVIALAERSTTGVFHVAGPEIVDRVAFATLVARSYGLDTRLLRPRATNELGLAAPRPLRCGLRTDKLAGTLGRSMRSPAEGLAAYQRFQGGF